jgi:dipeptidyl aminopeptidase/acylaminoacyl peptidase
VLETYPAIEPGRLCCTGGSYGGYMSNWILGHTDRFCCIATQRSISNWMTMYGISDIPPVSNFEVCSANPYTEKGIEEMWNVSPLKYIMNAKTPTLIIHSEEDYRCPIAEGYQLYTALVYLRVPARMVVFHGENHELSRTGKPAHRLRRLEEITGWFDKYTK